MQFEVSAGQIWQDDCYYHDTTTGECKRKYVLILASDSSGGDYITVVFTSQPNGLPENPACYIGYPRSGYYLGILGGNFHKETWIDFNSIETLDDYDLQIHVKQNRKKLLDFAFDRETLCLVLRCIMQMQDDITKQQWQLLANTIEKLNCK